MKLTLRDTGKATRYEELVRSVQHCDLCPRLYTKRKLLSNDNGNIDSNVMFVAEAPGRLGADRTGIPLHGDQTGRNFETLLANIGWDRESVFVSNAVLCNPLQENGNNGTPTKHEIENCAAYLEMQIEVVDPDIIVPLGAVALKALDVLAPHGLSLRESVTELTPWRRYQLYPLYHPGPRARIHRSLAKQRADFMQLSKLVDPLGGRLISRTRRSSTASTTFTCPSKFQQVAYAFLLLGKRMTYFKLAKLLYLFDYRCLELYGRTVASDIYIRQVDGPWPPALHRELEQLDGFEVRRFFTHKTPMISLGSAGRFELALDQECLEAIADVYHSYGSMSNAQIKASVYNSQPMRHILREERNGKNLVNKPVLYKENRPWNRE